MSLPRAAEKALDGKAAGKKAMSSTQPGSTQGIVHLLNKFYWSQYPLIFCCRTF